jgi:hypothetical protein
MEGQITLNLTEIDFVPLLRPKLINKIDTSSTYENFLTDIKAKDGGYDGCRYQG